MCKFITIMLILFTSSFSFGQVTEYKSKERDAYYERQIREHKEFKPIKKREVLNFKNRYFDFHRIDDYTPFSDSLYDTPFQIYYFDVILGSIKDESMVSPPSEYIGNIDKMRILKHEKKEQFEAFIYESSELDDVFMREYGIWVALSYDSGTTWEYLYTGIVQQQPLFLKWYSSVPLIKSDNELQIEACLLRQLTPSTFSDFGVTYEVVKDGLLLNIDLNTLRKDTDGDGLTDIVEEKLFTNCKSKDTDGDGITDNLDLNPRFSVPRTDKTEILEFALDMSIKLDSAVNIVSSLVDSKINFVNDTTETILIVSDSPDMQSVQPKSKRVIVLTEMEYNRFNRKYKNRLYRVWITPLFKVDGETETYLFSKDLGIYGGDYIVRKTERGWEIEMVSYWIS